MPTDQTTLFPVGAGAANAPARPATPRQLRRAADWQQQLARAYAYARNNARDEREGEAIDTAYEAALEKGPDFARYRRKSAFMQAPKVALDRNQRARIKFIIEAIRRGAWKGKAVGQHAGDIKHSVIEVLDALMRLAVKHGRVFPSLVGLGVLATRSKQTVINAINTLQFYGFITVHRRIKRMQTPLGVMTVQDTNAYDIHEPNLLGRIAARVFAEWSESNSKAARPDKVYSTEKEGPKERDFPGRRLA